MNRRIFRKLLVAYLSTVIAAWAALAIAFSLAAFDDLDNPLVATVAFPIAAALGLFFLFLVIGIGLFVYHDARLRGMQPAPWVIVAVLVPYFIGLVAYLLVRQPVQVLCPSCGNRTSSEAAFCPRCGKELKWLCVKCQQPVLTGARFCSGCGTEVAAG